MLVAIWCGQTEIYKKFPRKSYMSCLWLLEEDEAGFDLEEHEFVNMYYAFLMQ
jgi:hypothetical protein